MSIPSRKENYRLLAKAQLFPFQAQPWWLDLVCGPEGWDVAVSLDEDGQAIGAMPFGTLGWKGLPLIRMPLFTAFHHIWLRDLGSDRSVRQYHWEYKTLAELVSRIPAKWVVDQLYAPPFSNGLPFFWAGFRIQTRYTYQLQTQLPAEEMWKEMEAATRNQIRKAKPQVQVRRDGTPEQLYELLRLLYEKQGKRVPFALAELQNIDAALSSREMRTIYLATDDQGWVHAACYVVWDQGRAYGLLSGAHPEFRKSGALYLVLWRALKDAAKREALFDFEGSMLPRIERVFRSFGAKRVPYLRMVRYKYRWLEALAVLAGKNR